MPNITYPRPTVEKGKGARAPRHPVVRFHSLGPDEWGIEGPVSEVTVGVPVEVRTKSGKSQTVIPLALVETGEPAWADCEVGVWQIGRPGRWVRDPEDERKWLVSVNPDMVDHHGTAPVLRKDGTVRFVTVSEPALTEPDEWGNCLFAPAPKGAAD
jgi:hypothetical protein